jgi:ParB-like chromosome segregation protein Spo0J
MQNYKQHPLSMMFPPMAKDAFRNLCADIADNGLQFAIILFQGMILDGWHRYLACKQLGIEPISKEFQGDLVAARNYVISANHHRRHAKPAQIAMTAAEFATLPHGGHRGTAEEQKVALKPMTVAEASKVFGVNTRYIKMARLVLGSGDGDLIAEVKDCRKQLADAAREVQSRRSKQERVTKTQRSDKPPPASEPGKNTLEPGDGLNGGGAEDEGITGEPVGASAAPEGAAEKPTAIEEPEDNTKDTADGRSQGGSAGNDSAGELASRRALSAAVGAEPLQTSAPENDTVELECASNHADPVGDGCSAEEPSSAPRPAKGAGAGDGSESTPEPLGSTVNAAAGSNLAGSVDDDRSADEMANGPGDAQRTSRPPAPKVEEPLFNESGLFGQGELPRLSGRAGNDRLLLEAHG